jgi:hypothetical protein
VFSIYAPTDTVPIRLQTPQPAGENIRVLKAYPGHAGVLRLHAQVGRATAGHR